MQFIVSSKSQRPRHSPAWSIIAGAALATGIILGLNLGRGSYLPELAIEREDSKPSLGPGRLVKKPFPLDSLVPGLIVPIGKISIDLDKIIYIESKCNPKVYIRKTGARGLCQVTPSCLKDYNNHHKIKYSKQDMFTPLKNITVASWYLGERIPQLLKRHGKPVTTRNVLISYNAGYWYVVKNWKLKRATKKYIKDYWEGE